MATKKNPAVSFEDSLKQLENITQAMEGGNIPLDQALKYFEEGVTLIRDCQKILTEAEHKVQILTQSQGKNTLTDFSGDTRSDE